MHARAREEGTKHVHHGGVGGEAREQGDPVHIAIRIRLAYVNACASTLPWVCMTALGRPLDPDVCSR